MIFVVDASVAAKWLVPEAGSDDAESLARKASGLLAPSLLLIEIASFLWKSIRLGRFEDLDAQGALTRIETLVTLWPDEQLCRRALEIARDIKHPVYDCMYLALAVETRSSVVSYDSRFLSRVRSSRFNERITSLADAVG